MCQTVAHIHSSQHLIVHPEDTVAKHPAFLKKEVATICYSVVHGLLNFTREHLQENTHAVDYCFVLGSNGY